VIQAAYNEEHGITPTSIIKAIDEGRESVEDRDYALREATASRPRFRTAAERAAHVTSLEADMKRAAADLDFERAARLRDEIRNLRIADLGLAASPVER
jgi:excinuclease ABC subunit B